MFSRTYYTSLLRRSAPVLAWFLPSYLLLDHHVSSTSNNMKKSVFHHNLLLAHCDEMTVSVTKSTTTPTPTTTATSHLQQLTSSLTASCAASTTSSIPSSSSGSTTGTSCRKLVCHSYPANNPSEDRMVLGSHNNWSYGAVFDGHGGWQVSEVASKVLINLLLQSLEEHKNSTEKETYNEIQIDQIIVEVFHDMERLIIDSIRPAFQLGFGEVAKVGSCVLVALKKDDRLIISNCGDCRAVLGSSNPNSSSHNSLSEKFYATRINRDHNCRVPYEQLQLQLKHPKEDNLVVCRNSHACYVKGRLQLTRSLGDAYLKYPEFNGSPDKSKNSGRYIPEPYTPPYVSHDPDVHHIRLQPNDRFVILGTDGLWDYLPDQEAVEIVRTGLQKQWKEEDVARLLVDRALEIAAHESGMSLDELKKLNPGRQRRGRHDDTTAVVMYF